MDTPTWHSINPNLRDPAHHNNRQCEDGNNIEARYLRDGTGNLRLCERCKAINMAQREAIRNMSDKK